MKDLLDYKTAIKILRSNIFDDDCVYMVGAIRFVAEAFDLNVKDVCNKLEALDELDINNVNL